MMANTMHPLGSGDRQSFLLLGQNITHALNNAASEAVALDVGMCSDNFDLLLHLISVCCIASRIYRGVGTGLIL